MYPPVLLTLKKRRMRTEGSYIFLILKSLSTYIIYISFNIFVLFKPKHTFLLKTLIKNFKKIFLFLYMKEEAGNRMS